ncbi:hypothetical protein J1N35_043951 [Gossypium stocksii]|uniref:Uncharacterized protein n=1 Tax=Gossypium stocksii TaxID=47602 RepID=A0A9D3ZFF3_9ROSI|nr:hypothetical protein J1N35_043951 [Gossypium stocksii]
MCLRVDTICLIDVCTLSTSSAPPVSPHRVNIQYESVDLLIQAMTGAFQRIGDANPAPASQRLPLERLRVFA